MELTAKMLEGREARCTCGQTVPSSRALEGNGTRLAFFEYRGPESKSATDSCKNCGYYEVAHNPPASQKICLNFEPRGDWGYDTYYCGCRGWD